MRTRYNISTKYIFVVGGVFSGTGKGIGAASIALLMKMRGHKVQLVKFDPYLNINAGTMSPGQHGECYLCNDGSETDLDLGHYERITGIEVSSQNIFTSGTLYKELISEEEEGRYLGKTLQIIPHVTDKIQKRLADLSADSEIVFAEIGGTVGDLESGPFLEAARQFKQKNRDDVMIILVAPVLWVPTIQEFKTKPLQNSVKDLQSFGLQPDMILCRVDRPLPADILDKVSDLTNVHREAVFDAPDVKSIYQVPIEFWERHVDDLIADKFHLPRNGVRIHKYRESVERYVNAEQMSSVEIGIVGKYDNCEEAYISLKEALYHAGLSNDVHVKRRWISAVDLENAKDSRGIWRHFEGLHGVIVPGGFDSRGVEGKIRAIRYCRERKIPYLGICLGLQCAVIENARNVLGLEGANSMEFDPICADPVIHYVKGQEDITKKCGTMRLGSFACDITKDSLASDLYKRKTIHERHRHRYEVNPKYREEFDKKGFHVSGVNPQTGLVEIMELDRSIHPFFIGTQAHPEFRSRLNQPSPLFNGLISAAITHRQQNTTSDDVHST